MVLVIDNLLFAFDSDVLLDSDIATLNELASKLKAEAPDATLSITGHTDSVGKDDLNMRLSQDRANSVSQYLASQGVVSSRINSVGMGKSQPIADNNTENGRAQNRRVEIVINAPESV